MIKDNLYSRFGFEFHRTHHILTQLVHIQFLFYEIKGSGFYF